MIMLDSRQQTSSGSVIYKIRIKWNTSLTSVCERLKETAGTGQSSLCVFCRCLPATRWRTGTSPTRWPCCAVRVWAGCWPAGCWRLYRCVCPHQWFLSSGLDLNSRRTSWRREAAPGFSSPPFGLYWTDWNLFWASRTKSTDWLSSPLIAGFLCICNNI